MKKTIILTFLAVVFAMTFICGVAAAESCEDKICEIVKCNERILDAKCVVYERNCLVAIKTEKFVTRSDYEEYLEKVSEEIKAQCEIDNVIITRSPKVMHKITQLNKLDSAKRQEVIKEIIERELNRFDHSNPRPIQPRMY